MSPTEALQGLLNEHQTAQQEAARERKRAERFEAESARLRTHAEHLGGRLTALRGELDAGQENLAKAHNTIDEQAGRIRMLQEQVSGLRIALRQEAAEVAGVPAARPYELGLVHPVPGRHQVMLLADRLRIPLGVPLEDEPRALRLLRELAEMLTRLTGRPPTRITPATDPPDSLLRWVAVDDGSAADSALGSEDGPFHYYLVLRHQDSQPRIQASADAELGMPVAVFEGLEEAVGYCEGYEWKVRDDFRREAAASESAAQTSGKVA